ncbi:hypothetical protein J6590_072248 [Homalodisca vitripennis]|nr:hypothetical protein J6590_072248 [Homalodisca vitripennis]
MLRNPNKDFSLKLRFPSSATGLAPCYVIKAQCAACLVEAHLNTVQRKCVFLGFVILRSFHLLKKCTVFIDMDRKGMFWQSYCSSWKWTRMIIPIIGFPIQNFCVYNIKFCPRRFDSVDKDKIEYVHLPPPSEIDWIQKAEEFWVN